MPRPQLEPDPADRALKSERDAAAPWRAAAGSRRILGVRVDATRYEETARDIVERAAAGAGGMVCVATVHTVMEAVDDAAFRLAVNGADRVTPDGVPLVWALRALGIPAAERVYGPTLTPLVCGRAAAAGIPVGLLGSTWPVLSGLVEELTERFPELAIPFVHSPPFEALSADDDRALVEAIRDSGARILFVGLGCPKQERWMAAHRESLDCVLVGVGAAFDFLAGAKAQAPAWMQRAGLEWLFRLACEPRRLWRRYLLHNPRFVWRLARQLVAARGASGRRP